MVVMVLIMTMTPLHMTQHGHDIAAVGLVLSGHTFGMYGLSPISGRLTDRSRERAGDPGRPGHVSARGDPGRGRRRPMAASCCSSRCSSSGYGWNLGYVAGSALLTQDLSLAERTRLQGLTDGLIWSSAAAASLGSGVVVACRKLRDAWAAGCGPGRRAGAPRACAPDRRRTITRRRPAAGS